ncbi:hypothetical protein ABZW18_33335 [Streptomyces sp. NPDC004647]|uniref:hypothetical protein n=1 Tax=Streptomyces sp. NPDC004647 TaxID=3154671 RepID=UPI0033A2F451
MLTEASAPAAFRESTAEALDHLRRARRAQQREQRRGNAVLLYGVLVVAALLGTPYLLAAADASQPGSAQGDLAGRLLTGLPVTLPAVLATVLFLALRNAAWRGPVLVDLPTAFWAVPLPLLRRPLLMPRFLTSAVFSTLVGTVTGAVAGFLVATGVNGSWPGPTVAGAWAGAVTGVGSVLSGVLVERHDSAVVRKGRGLFALGWTAAAGLLGLSVLSFVHDLPTWAGHVLLWSGPWGWAAQPLLAAVGGRAPGWPLASALLVGLLLLGVRESGRAVALIPGESLRRRALVVSQVTASLFSMDLRQAKFSIQGTHRRRARPALRLPAPRRRWLVVPWRDATGLLRAPGRPAWALLLLAAAVVLTASMGTLALRLQILCSGLALAAMYLAAAQLAEPARVDSDDMRRSVNLPYSSAALALWHAAVPAALLLAATALGLVGGALAGVWHPGLLVLLLCVPTMVGAALVSAYRGSMPPHVAIGVETPFGNTAPLQMTAWYLRGPLGALMLTVPVLVLTADRGALGAGGAAWLLAVGAVQLLWARHAAGQQA